MESLKLFLKKSRKVVFFSALAFFSVFIVTTATAYEDGLRLLVNQSGCIFVKIQNYDSCNGCGLCKDICPTVFTVVDDKVRIVRQPYEAELDFVKLAKTSCPCECILVYRLL